ncbi:hypothetical protein Tco_0595229 [Tanacetum coccineum]
MEAHTERMERFKKAIFKQREQIDDRMAEVFGLLKELTTNRALEKVLVREEARHPITKHVNSISLIRMEVLTPLRWMFLILYQAYGNLYATIGRKTHLLEDKQISIVGVFDEVIWEALEGNTRDLDSIWEETRQDYNFTRSGFKNARTVPGDGVAIPSDAVRTYKRRRQKLCDGVRM